MLICNYIAHTYMYSNYIFHAYMKLFISFMLTLFMPKCKCNYIVHACM